MLDRTAAFLDFEKPALDVLARLEELEAAAASGTTTPEKHLNIEIARQEIQLARVLRLVYRSLTPAQVVQVARHPGRPQGPDFIRELFTDFVPLAGDRRFGDDPALIGGLATFAPTGHSTQQSVVVLATRKGKTTEERLKYNFGMPKPEGYRKAQRLCQLAEKFGLPVLAFVDTPGAYPGIDAEERGQAQAIAESIQVLLGLSVPVISVITGEGGSGGALALAAADRVLLPEYSTYSVISPEGCAAILWKEATKETVPLAAAALKLTAPDLFKLKLIDGVIDEPVGGAHRNPALHMQRVGQAVAAHLNSLLETPPPAGYAAARRVKFLALGR